MSKTNSNEKKQTIIVSQHVFDEYVNLKNFLEEMTWETNIPDDHIVWSMIAWFFDSLDKIERGESISECEKGDECCGWCDDDCDPEECCKN